MNKKLNTQKLAKAQAAPRVDVRQIASRHPRAWPVKMLVAASLLAIGVIGTRTAKAGDPPLDPKVFSATRPEGVDFEPFPAFPAGARLALLVGDPKKPGPYVIRVRVPDGVKLMPHVHPEDRIYTVISGVFYIGYGTEFDESKLVAYGPGSVVVLPANTPHFHWAKSGTYITQVSGFGPLGISYVDQKDDPRNQVKK